MNDNRESESRSSHTESAPRSSMWRDVTAAYTAAGARIGAWAIVSAIVYRLAGPAHFATLALIRGTIGILNYTSVGLAPALTRLLAEAGKGQVIDARRVGTARPATEPSSTATGESTLSDSGQISGVSSPDERSTYSTAVIVAGTSMVAGMILAVVYARVFDRLHIVPASLVRQAPWAVVLIGFGALARLFSDTSSALLQIRGQIALDNYLQAACDTSWAIATLMLYHHPGLLTASITYAAAGMLLVLSRWWAVARLDETPWPPRLGDFQSQIVGRLLSFGSLVLLAQLAEYFYAPTDYILINHFFGPGEVAAYAPGVQIDLGLLMLVIGLATVLLPRTAIAHESGSAGAVRKYYVRGTLASIALLVAAAVGVWLLYPLIFRIWFGPHPPNTRAILDLVLIGTVIGGSSAVGRSVLIGMGKVKAFTITAIIAGVVNVIASYCFVKYTGLGLRGILYGTLVAVIGRCGLWMPWFVLRNLRHEKT